MEIFIGIILGLLLIEAVFIYILYRYVGKIIYRFIEATTAIDENYSNQSKQMHGIMMSNYNNLEEQVQRLDGEVF